MAKVEKERTLYDVLRDRMAEKHRRAGTDARAQIDAVEAVVARLEAHEGIEATATGYRIKEGEPPNNITAGTFKNRTEARMAVAELLKADESLVTASLCACDLEEYGSQAGKRGEVTVKLIGPADDVFTVQLRYWRDGVDAETF